MDSLAIVPSTPSTSQPTRHRGRPALTPEERVARIEARKLARRKTPQQLPAAMTPEDPPAVVPLPPRVYFVLSQRARAFLGLALGAFVPLASYSIVHIEVARRPQLWVLVAGGLAYSAISVYTWAVQAFHYRLKALGFVVLLEGTLTFCTILWLSLSGLAILMILNAITAATTLQKPKEEEPTSNSILGL